MEHINNIASQVGESILFKLDGPITGIQSITGYTDSTVGEDQFKFFEKEFRYTLDGINWGEWIDLSNNNLQQIPIQQNYDFDIQYRYTRRGDVGGDLEWCWINLETVKGDVSCGESFSDSVFSHFFSCCCDEEVLKWCVNVLRKLYENGIVSKTLIRGGDANRNNADRDYIDFWRSITCYFALFVGYARKFENLQQEDLLLSKYIKDRGIFIDNTQSLQDMQWIMKNYYSQINQRGTVSIIKSRSSEATIDGELLRLISYNQIKDEFLFAVSNQQTCGWTVNLHSPLYKGVQNQKELVKIFKIPTQWDSASDIYPLINSSACTVSEQSGELILSIVPVSGQKSGISVGSLISQTQGLFEVGLFEAGLFQEAGSADQPIDQFKTNVDPSIDYHLSFYAKTNHSSAKITVAGLGFDVFDNSANPQAVDLSIGSNVALQQVTLPKINEWYHVRMIIFASSQKYVNNQDILKTSLNVGSNLKMSNAMARFAPEVVLDNTNSDIANSTVLEVKDVKFAPVKTDYGKGFVGGSAIAQIWLKNNSLQFDQQEVENNIRNYLIPYKMGLVNNFL